MKSTHNKLIVCDVDMVLLNWTDAFLSWLHTTGIAELHSMNKVFERNTYQMSSWLGVQSHILQKYIAIFNQTHHMKNLAPLDESIKYVAKLVEEGYTLHALTSFSTDLESHEMRKHNLIKVFGERAFSGFTFLPLRASKADQLKTFANPYTDRPFYVDDHGDHIIDGEVAGLNSILYDQSKFFTPSDKYKSVVHDWHELYCLITGN